MNKDLAILSGFVVLALAVAAAIFFYGVRTSNTLAVSVIAEGTRAPIAARVNYVIKNKDEWQQFSELFNEATNTFPLSNFSKKQVLAVFAGVEPTSGYSIAVSHILDTQHKRIVEITLTTPGPNCTVAKVQTSPYQIVAVPATVLPLTHTEHTKIRACK